MKIGVVVSQMAVVIVYLCFGYFVKRRKWVSDAGVRDISWLLANVAGPAQMLSASLNQEAAPDKQSALLMILFTVISYTILVAFGHFIGRLLRAPKEDWKFFKAMSVFGNIGFLGIPFAQAVFGDGCVIYIVIFNLGLNLLLYTMGYQILRPDGGTGAGLAVSMRRMINPGVICSVLSILFFFFDVQMPEVFDRAVLYAGNTVTFMALFVIGTNMASIRLASIFTNRRLILFVALRQVLIPVLMILAFRNFVPNSLMLSAIAVCLAVPVGNVPSMIATANGCDMKTLTCGTVLSTLLSVFTMTIVLLFV